ncbi:MAG: tripartite tricarboxylate transporter permease [Alphaproteobacteria bacterium]|nr:tripartite tricarboxylate transporter permease [Alphaproteobacteria bacterium]MDA7999792.1 tripartite tricarboxylate transporter permease [Alphaproteobacteria bacterium]MDA8003303.1 tripartite tricarboxylate transporter permease [Alphaproteobacteria bacterium]MDA8005011.1 tripartite tricarboxylate transporter permease [Alphaproteobacteria bacterium]MDA8012376.1 tripartite tricarboxylate transporter permease [Alphaproteobacteria bacterium]
MESVLGGLLEILRAETLLLICAGTVAGVLVGALPGLSSSMAVALLLPFSIYLEPIPAIAMLAALYCAGTFGGSITAILINAPGAPPAAATALDGYPLAKAGKAGQALGMAAASSVVGGIFSLFVLILAAPTLARLAYKFGPPEYFALTVFGLSMLASISGNSAVKNLIGGAFGVLIATVGVDLTTGVERFTFGIPELYEGISFIPVLIGLFAMAELLKQAGHADLALERFSVRAMKLPSLADFRRVWKTILRSSGIGTFIGVLPAEGATVAAMVGYNEARRWSRNKDNFGKGELEGVAGPETANNAATGGAMVPTLALGIPGSATAAVILGGLQIHGLRPGPYLFESQPTLLYAIFFAMLIANFVFLAFGLAGARYFSRISLIPRQFLWPAVFCLCVIGAYGVGQSLADVYIMLVAGLIGYFLNRSGFSPAPIIMGIVLGSLMENSLAQSMILFDQDAWRFFTRPIAVFFFLLATLSVFAAPIGRFIRHRLARRRDSAVRRAHGGE